MGIGLKLRLSTGLCFLLMASIFYLWVPMTAAAAQKDTWDNHTENFSTENGAGTSKANPIRISTAGQLTGTHQTILPGGFIGDNLSGTTIDCGFDGEKDPKLSAISTETGGVGTLGANDIAAEKTVTFLNLA